MALQFTTTRDAARLHGVKVLVYGQAGVGKTSLCATAPAPLIISAEAGLLSLRGHDIPVATVRTVDDLTEIHNWLTSSPDAARFETICLDSVTEIAETVLVNAKRQVKDVRQAYMALMEQMLAVFKSFRDLAGKHVYFSAKMEHSKDEASGAIKYQPMMPGAKLAQQIPYLFDEVLHMDVGKDQNGAPFRFLRTQPDFQYVAKDRSGALGNPEEPNLSTVITKMLA